MEEKEENITEEVIEEETPVETTTEEKSMDEIKEEMKKEIIDEMAKEKKTKTKNVIMTILDIILIILAPFGLIYNIICLITAIKKKNITKYLKVKIFAVLVMLIMEIVLTILFWNNISGLFTTKKNEKVAEGEVTTARVNLPVSASAGETIYFFKDYDWTYYSNTLTEYNRSYKYAEYTCSTDSCKVYDITSKKGEKAIINDGSLFLYNILNKSVEYTFEDYSNKEYESVHIVQDVQDRIFYIAFIEKNDKSFEYRLFDYLTKAEKIKLTFSDPELYRIYGGDELSDIISNKVIIVMLTDTGEEYQVYDLNTKKKVFAYNWNINNYYAVGDLYDDIGKITKLYDKNYNLIYDDAKDGEVVTYAYDYDSKKDEIWLATKNKYYYFNGSTREHTSGYFDNILKIYNKGYILAVVNNRAKLFNPNESEVADLFDYKETYVHPIGGYEKDYEDYITNEKYGDVITIYTDSDKNCDNLTNDELYNVVKYYDEGAVSSNRSDMLKTCKGYVSDNTDGELLGYEYVYQISTGKVYQGYHIIGGYGKPVLYLYPETDMNVTVNFAHPENLTTTYPKFNKSWNVLVKSNGDIYDAKGKYYYGLYWEEATAKRTNFKEGFYVEAKDAIDFLEEKLSVLGLSDREANEFIMYWLPILEKNGKNLVYFETTESRQEFNELKISPKPDSLLRIAIHVKKVDKKTNIKEQKLPTFSRHGFTAVEWGGVTY